MTSLSIYKADGWAPTEEIVASGEGNCWNIQSTTSSNPWSGGVYLLDTIVALGCELSGDFTGSGSGNTWITKLHAHRKDYTPGHWEDGLGRWQDGSWGAWQVLESGCTIDEGTDYLLGTSNGRRNSLVFDATEGWVWTYDYTGTGQDLPIYHLGKDPNAAMLVDGNTIFFRTWVSTKAAPSA